ncbi:MAG: acyl-ACP thioesterase domain-containing protein [Spirochaetota bacterium]
MEDKSTVEKPPVWKDTYNLRSYEIDIKHRVFLTTLCNYLQESAWNHARVLELGFEQLKDNRQIWVLSRLLIELDAIPLWGDTIFIETWAKGTERLFALRDFNIFTAQGDVVGGAASAWLIIDEKTKRPSKLDFFSSTVPVIPGRHATESKPEKLPELAAQKKKYDFKVRYSDLDVNSHVNNVKYIEWILDSFEIDCLQERTLKKFEINYMAESIYGDNIAVNSEKVSDDPFLYLINIVRKQDNKELCRARVELA